MSNRRKATISLAPAPPRLTLSPDMPDHVLLTGHGRVARLPLRLTDEGFLLFVTDFPRPLPALEILGPGGDTVMRYPVRHVAVGRNGADVYGVERA